MQDIREIIARYRLYKVSAELLNILHTNAYFGVDRSSRSLGLLASRNVKPGCVNQLGETLGILSGLNFVAADL